MMAMMPFKVIHDHQFWYQSKAHMRLPISDCLIPTYIISFTVSKLLHIFTTLIRDKNLNLQSLNLASRN